MKKETFRSLTIRPTFKCNFDCSFCAQKDKLKNPGEEDESAILKYLENNKFNHYIFSGGEPLLKFDFLKKSFLYLPEKSSKVIHSNASLLNEEIVSWMNKNKIALSFSINSIENGEKSLKELVKSSLVGESLPDLINTINLIGIKKVVLKNESKEDILLSIYAIHQTFPTARIYLSWDYWDSENLNVQDFFNMEFILICLKKYDLKFYEWFELKGIPCAGECKKCIDSGTSGINPDGSTFRCVLQNTKIKRLSLEQSELLLKIKNSIKKEEKC